MDDAASSVGGYSSSASAQSTSKSQVAGLFGPRPCWGVEYATTKLRNLVEAQLSQQVVAANESLSKDLKSMQQ